MSPFDLAGLRDRLEAINKETEQEGFWDSKEKAQKLLKEKKSIENSVSEYAEKMHAERINNFMSVRRKSNWYIYFIAFAITLAFAAMAIFAFRWYLFPTEKTNVGLDESGGLAEDFPPENHYRIGGYQQHALFRRDGFSLALRQRRHQSGGIPLGDLPFVEIRLDCRYAMTQLG